MYTGADLGGGGGRGADLGGGAGTGSAFRGGGHLPPPFRDIPTFGTIQEIQFWPTDLKIFLKAPLAPIYINFEGGARAEKRRFFGQNFPKSA